MKKLEHDGPERAIVVFFPPRRLGAQIARRFSELGYRILLFLLSDEEENYFSHLRVPNQERVIPVRVTSPLARFWEDLDPSLKGAILRARVGINFIGRDFSSLKVTGRGEEWSIDASDPAQVRFIFVEMILGNIEMKERSLWFNLGLGHHTKSSTGEMFCNTKYGLTGLAKAFELTPRLNNLEVISICLTYFNKDGSGAGSMHCAHCVTEELAGTGKPLSAERDIPGYLLHRIEELWEKTN